ncbi:hypothetical protein [Ruminococcus sp.]|uniref:hypothetical protein n=1 Tax=Ruminococcus sp. TaxID=41978 RepID=UPI003AF01C9C
MAKMASKGELLSSITPDMRLTSFFFLKVYGYELTWPGFAEIALTRLEEQGCSKARTYYADIVAAYEQEHENDMKRVAEWYRKQLDKKGDDTDWKKTREAELLSRKKQLLRQKLKK